VLNSSSPDDEQRHRHSLPNARWPGICHEAQNIAIWIGRLRRFFGSNSAVRQRIEGTRRDAERIRQHPHLLRRRSSFNQVASATEAGCARRRSMRQWADSLRWKSHHIAGRFPVQWRIGSAFNFAGPALVELEPLVACQDEPITSQPSVSEADMRPGLGHIEVDQALVPAVTAGQPIGAPLP
jgi:hypothetical protein